MKKILLALFILTLSISAFAGISYAYLTAKDSELFQELKESIENIELEKKITAKRTAIYGKLKITKDCLASVRGVTFQMPGATDPSDTCAALGSYKGTKLRIKGILHRKAGRRYMDNIESIKVLEKPVKKWIKINGVLSISKGDQANVDGILFDFPEDKNITDYEGKNVEVYGKLYTQFCNPYPYEQCMGDGVLRVMTKVKTIKILDTENTSDTSNTSATSDTSLFALNFSAGRLLGPLFEVKITNGNITYLETDGIKQISKPERALLPDELADIRKTTLDSGLVTLQSENFTQDPLLPEGYYRIALSIDGKENMLECRISAPEEIRNCQKQIDPLRLKLNSILGVNIY